MTLVRLGYVAMSVHVQNSSPSQTMTYAHFQKLLNRDAAIRKLERIAESNLHNCLRLLRHNLAHDIHFFRLSSRLIPLATHEALKGWDYISPVCESLFTVGEFAKKHKMRIDFHPDHFVVINSPKVDVLKASIKTLQYHLKMLKGMKIDPTHRCVLHVGGSYNNKEKALEQFVENWGSVPASIQKMIILENDDKSFNLQDTLYLCEKLGLPFVFDYHHHLANHQDEEWSNNWERITGTWEHSKLPVKMHISSPKDEKKFRDHADYIDAHMFLTFLREIKGSVPEIDCMIEAKKKDEALFQLIKDLKKYNEVDIVDGASFYIK
ncbi:UV DNA damage repair endonuclease UvsE [Calidifontibacillus oryziterrae]|uniref:UV DNA damage repair endonuclease UvsE n=1 Tax=Calidifontibacillus oryziterrae TaxID=1191699 RepID=UPI000319A8AC|nr:UV DNA damage repair endonuclease UvsE [Calidifontibacillus oryziterrae]